MQRCADTLLQRDGAMVRAAVAGNNPGLCVLCRPVTRVVPRYIAGAIVDEQIDALVSTTVWISDVVDAFYGHGQRDVAAQRHIDVARGEDIRW